MVIDVACFHNSQSVQSHTLQQSEKYFVANRWKKYLPLTTPVSKLTTDGNVESFAEAVERMADNRLLSELQEFLRNTKGEAKDLRILVTQLLQKKKLEAAFVLASNIHPSLRIHRGVTIALCLGGAKMGFDEEMEDGRQLLQQLLAEMSSEEKKKFYTSEIMPLLSPMIHDALFGLDKPLTKRLLGIVSCCFVDMPDF
ncbi:MAG: hypothetical protein HQM04_16975 [Magnetococcales bacterium]|nr:hypothetical protein [Magnetococcales bacterium]MBF0116724.1 hypothetical protein [Magnetococcales bacterium]